MQRGVRRCLSLVGLLHLSSAYPLFVQAPWPRASDLPWFRGSARSAAGEGQGGEARTSFFRERSHMQDLASDLLPVEKALALTGARACYLALHPSTAVLFASAGGRLVPDSLRCPARCVVLQARAICSQVWARAGPKSFLLAVRSRFILRPSVMSIGRMCVLGFAITGARRPLGQRARSNPRLCECAD